MHNVNNPARIYAQIPAVNFHLWQPCNMRCHFCFAEFQDVKKEMRLPKGHMPKEECAAVVDRIAAYGFEKINFAGGEPTLCPWLPEMIAQAKRHGMTTSIITNGSRITKEWMDSARGNLDWIGLSIDTVDPAIQIRSGRALRGKDPVSEQEYMDVVNMIKRYKMRLKINTVVHSLNWEEDLTPFIRLAKPERWKLLQALPVGGQNDARIDEYIVSQEQFETYVRRSQIAEKDGIAVVPESNELMTDSYAMVDPAGRFYDNAQGFHRYSSPILEVGVEEALKQASINPERFRRRGGEYDWGGKPPS